METRNSENETPRLLGQEHPPHPKGCVDVQSSAGLAPMPARGGEASQPPAPTLHVVGKLQRPV